MEFLLKKTQGSKKNSATFQELIKKLELAHLQKNQAAIKKDMDELKKLTKTEDLEKIIDKKNKSLGELFNLVHAPSIEKNDDVGVGTVYFNTKTDKLRLKIKSGWVTVNTE